MRRQPRADPVRQTLLGILRQLNQAEAAHEGDLTLQGLELSEIERRIAIANSGLPPPLKPALAVGLLLRNGLVKAAAPTDPVASRGLGDPPHYLITPEGKKLLAESVHSDDRIA